MYCTIDDIAVDMSLPTLISMTNDDKTGVVNAEVVNKYIDEEESYINSYLTEQYTLPITSPVGLNILKQIEVALVVCDLYRRGLGMNYPDTLEMRRTQAINDLVKIQKGQILLQAKTIYERKYITSQKKRIINPDDIY